MKQKHHVFVGKHMNVWVGQSQAFLYLTPSVWWVGNVWGSHTIAEGSLNAQWGFWYIEFMKGTR